MPTARLDEQLCFALYSASNHISQLYRPLLEPLGLTYTQFLVLMALWEKENITITQLAKRTGLSKATMTPLLKRLEQKEFIQRLTLSDNERQKIITLTQTGRALSKQSEAVTQEAFCATKLSQQQANDIIAICQQMLSDK